jgi:hypothetical protein
MDFYFITLPSGLTYEVMGANNLQAIDIVKKDFEPTEFFGAKVSELFTFNYN